MKKYNVYLPKQDGEWCGVKLTAAGEYIGSYESDDEPDAWEIAETFSDKVGTMQDARWSDYDTIADENGTTRLYVLEA